MKANSLALISALLFSAGCIKPSYLPRPAKIGESIYGAYISISPHEGRKISGELIALDQGIIFVLPDLLTGCVTIPLTEVDDFKLTFARPLSYGWTIPIYMMASLAHGYGIIFFFPVNFLTTVIITVVAENEVIYKKKDISLGKTSMFARFPQGIPPGVDVMQLQSAAEGPKGRHLRKRGVSR